MLPQNKIKKFHAKENFNLDINIYEKEHKKSQTSYHKGARGYFLFYFLLRGTPSRYTRKLPIKNKIIYNGKLYASDALRST
jgi:hypothetical protein